VYLITPLLTLQCDQQRSRRDNLCLYFRYAAVPLCQNLSLHEPVSSSSKTGRDSQYKDVQNLSDVTIPFIPRRMVHVVGTLAEHLPKVGDKVAGITVQRKAAEAMRVMTPEDLGVYNKVSVGNIIQRQHMALSASFSKCRLALEVMFEGIDAEQDMGGVEGSCSGVDARILRMFHISSTHLRVVVERNFCVISAQLQSLSVLVMYECVVLIPLSLLGY
jgi:Pre-mRNA 3'-end-processing endonuclease polyadenylation factor C-term